MRTSSALCAMFLAALAVPHADAQNSRFNANPPQEPTQPAQQAAATQEGRSGQPSRSGQQPASRGSGAGTPQSFIGVPGSSILPMSNPVAPMGSPVAPMASPVQPFIQSPFIRYGSGGPTVVIPGPETSGGTGAPSSRPRRGRGRDVETVEPGVDADPSANRVGTGAIFAPTIPEPFTTQSTVAPLQRSLPAPAAINASSEIVAAAPERAVTPTAEPRPHRAPPAVGTSRAEVLENFGKPWGAFQAAGLESLYFENGLVVVFANGRVSSTR